MKITDYVASNINEFPTIAEVLGIKTTRQTTPKSALTEDTRKTIAELDFNTKTIKLMKTNPVFKQEIKLDDMTAMHKQAWFVLHSPKLCAVTFITNFYSSTIASMIRYTEMLQLPMDIITSAGKFKSSREYLVWYTEQQTRKDEFEMSATNIQLIIKHAPELKKHARKSIDELIEVLRSQIKLSGYDVSLQSIITTDGLNHGEVEDEYGKPKQWSRDYTKHYERYNQTLNDLLLMYISCKFYAQHDIKADFNNGIAETDIDSYTGDVILEAVQIHSRDEDVVVPRSACGLGLQNYMN